ncbi:MAG: hypothetical protein H7312_19785 [Tardiphaga sp.]|nr:hypothetical protein [Tardiphaga sp.]
MADADLDVIIRQVAKQQNKTLLAAAKNRRDHYLALAAKATDAGKKERFKQLARHATEHGAFAAKRLLVSADNTADSYARSMRIAAEAPIPVKPATAKTPAPIAKKAAPAKKAAKKKKA